MKITQAYIKQQQSCVLDKKLTYRSKTEVKEDLK